MSRHVREEPTIGSVDMSQIEYRRSPARGLQADDDHRFAGLWWRISLGVFVGMLGHSIVTGLYARWEIYTGLQALGAAFEDLEKDAKEAPIPPSHPAERSPTPTRARTPLMRPLAVDERCVGGKRFRRVENGWVQVLEPCRS